MFTRLKRRLSREDDGETLVEIVMSIAIMGICILAIGSMMVLSIKISAIHRAQATANAFLHNYAESIQSTYHPCNGCSTPPDYVSSLAHPDNFQQPTEAVEYWDQSAGAFTSTVPVNDPGLQQVTLTLKSTDGSVSESLVTIVGTLS